MSGSGGEMNKERRIYSSSGIEAKGLRKKKKERVVGGGWGLLLDDCLNCCRDHRLG
jgi:hypothetical protein